VATCRHRHPPLASLRGKTTQRTSHCLHANINTPHTVTSLSTPRTHGCCPQPHGLPTNTRLLLSLVLATNAHRMVRVVESMLCTLSDATWSDCSLSSLSSLSLLSLLVFILLCCALPVECKRAPHCSPSLLARSRRHLHSTMTSHMRLRLSPLVSRMMSCCAWSLDVARNA
jgi:hypothetical protein